MITQQDVKALFHYDPETGVVTKLVSTQNRVKVGDIVGSKTTRPDGKTYIRTTIKRVPYLLHRIIWLYCHGEFPDEIDHINGDGADNRLINLRNVSRGENMKNRRLPASSSSGCVGVSFNKSRNRWYASISVDKKDIHLGSYINKFDAIKARNEASIKYCFHKNHGSDRPL